VETPAVIDALDAMPARDVERLITHAQRRLARCFADVAFPATITSKRGGTSSSRASIRICASCWDRATLPEARATDG
jgi:hypothetical protein